MNINEIAKKAGVAKSTVSNVLTKKKYVSPETTAKVLKACEELNYVPNYFATNLVNSDTNIIGLLLEIGNDDYYSYYNNLFEGCVLEANKHGKQILIYFAPKEEDIATYLGQGKSPLSGAILLTPYQVDERIIELQRKHIPYVTIGTTRKENTLYSVDVNNKEATAKMFNHLIENGHHKILFINAMKNLEITNQRDEVVKELLKAHPRLEIKIVYAEDKENKAQKIITNHQGDYTAIVASSDIIAKDLYQYYETKGLKIGKDISIVALGGIKYVDVIKPKLTRVSQNYVTLGSASVKMLVQVMEKKKVQPIHKYFDSEIIYGESVARIKN